MAWLLFHFYGYKDGHRWCASWTWHHASVSRCKYGKPGNSPVGCLNLCAAFRYCICLACCTGWLACQFPDFLCGSQKILAGGIEVTIIQASDKSYPSHPALFCRQQSLQYDMPASCL